MLKKVAIAALAVSLLSLFPTISTYASPPCYSVNGSGVLTSGRDCTGSITIDSPVTSIGTAAFYQNTSLTSVTIGNSVSSISDAAFYQNTSLTSVTIGNSVTSIGGVAFAGNTSLASVIIGNSVTSIGDGAFLGTRSLTSVIIPNSVTNMGYAVFSDSALTSVTIGNSVTTIGTDAFYRTSLTSVTIPNSVTSIGESAFYLTPLTSVIIGNSVTTIGNSAFAENVDLVSVTFLGNAPSVGSDAFFNLSVGATAYVTEGATGFNLAGDPPRWNELIVERTISCTGGGTYTVVSNIVTANTSCAGIASIPAGVTSIGNGAFYGNTSLTSVTIPNSVTTIADDAFYGNTSLTSATIPNSVTSIGGYAFYNSTSLTSVTIGASVAQIGNGAFQNAPLTSLAIPNSVTIIGDDAFRDTSLTSVTIGTSVAQIGNGAFQNAPLTSLAIPNSVTSIGFNTFRDTSLTSVTIGNSVMQIGDGAFQDVPLTSLTIPNSVTNIDFNAFRNTSLTSVTFLGNAPSVGSDAFENLPVGATAYVSPSATGFEDSADPDSDGKWFKLVVTVGTAPSTDATITTGSTIKGQTLIFLGTPSSSLASAIAGSVTIASTRAADTSNTGSFMTNFARSDTNASVNKVVKYSAGSTPTVENFTSGDDYTTSNSVITNGDFMIVKVTAQDGSTVLYYKVVVTVVVPSATYSQSTLTESGANDGSITATITITLSVGSIFTYYESTDLATGRVSNVPAGLTAVLRSGPDRTFATLSFTGTATAHANADGISNLTVTFFNGDFTPNGVPSGANRNNIVIDFADPTDTIAPTLSSSSPADDATGVTINSNFVFTFSESVTAGTGIIRLRKSSDGSNVENFDVATSTKITGWGTTTITINPSADLLNLTGYYLLITTDAIKDASDNFYAGLSGASTLNFTTAATGGGGAPIPAPVIPTYRITYSANAADVITTPYDFNAYLTGQKITVTSQLPTRLGYSFVEWNTTNVGDGTSYKASANITVGSIDVILYAIWKINQYTIGFDSNGGPILNLNQITQDFNSTFTVPEMPQDGMRIGYTFLGWNARADGSGSRSSPSDKLRIGAANLTLFAQWKINRYTIAYDANGNDIGRIPPAVTQDFNSKITVSAPSLVFTRKGYTFNGWNLTRDSSGTSFKVGDTFIVGASNQTLYALWTPKEYQMTFVNSLKNPLPKFQFVSGGLVTSSPTPSSRTGFLFKGWSSKADKSNIVTFPYAPGVFRNVSLYAVWVKIK